MEDDVQAVRNALDELLAKASAGTTAFLDMYSDDAIWMLPRRWEDVDKEGARTFYQDVLDRNPTTFADNDNRVDEVLVVDGWAFVRATFRRPPRVLEGGGEPVRRGSRHLFIFRRQPDGSWKVFRDIFNNPPPSK